jgi:hypothetical protein
MLVNKVKVILILDYSSCALDANYLNIIFLMTADKYNEQCLAERVTRTIAIVRPILNARLEIKKVLLLFHSLIHYINTYLIIRATIH